MSSKDLEIKMEIDEIFQNCSTGIRLKAYFVNMPEKKVRRAIHILAKIYSDQKVISDEDFVFIVYMLSNEKLLKQGFFSEFIRSLGLIYFTGDQKSILINLIKEHFEALCKICTFELDDLLVKIFDRSDLFKYLETLVGDGGTAVLQHVSDILRYEDFSNTNISDESLEKLKNEINKRSLDKRSAIQELNPSGAKRR